MKEGIKELLDLVYIIERAYNKGVKCGRELSKQEILEKVEKMRKKDEQVDMGADFEARDAYNVAIDDIIKLLTQTL